MFLIRTLKIDLWDCLKLVLGMETPRKAVFLYFICVGSYAFAHERKWLWAGCSKPLINYFLLAHTVNNNLIEVVTLKSAVLVAHGFVSCDYHLKMKLLAQMDSYYVIRLFRTLILVLNTCSHWNLGQGPRNGSIKSQELDSFNTTNL